MKASIVPASFMDDNLELDASFSSFELTMERCGRFDEMKEDHSAVINGFTLTGGIIRYLGAGAR